MTYDEHGAQHAWRRSEGFAERASAVRSGAMRSRMPSSSD